MEHLINRLNTESVWLYEKNPQAKYNDFYNGSNPVNVERLLLMKLLTIKNEKID